MTHVLPPELHRRVPAPPDHGKGDARVLRSELALQSQPLPDDLGVERAGQPAITGDQEDAGGPDRLALLEQGNAGHRALRRLGHLTGHLPDRLRVGPHRGDALLGAPQAGRGDHLHGTRDLVDVPHAVDPVLYFLARGHVRCSLLAARGYARAPAYAGTSSASRSSTVASVSSGTRSPASAPARPRSTTRSDSPSSSGLPSASKSGPKSSTISPIASPSCCSSSSVSSPLSVIRFISSACSDLSLLSRSSRNSCTRSVLIRSR